MIDMCASKNIHNLPYYDMEHDGTLQDLERDLYSLPFQKFFGSPEVILDNTDF